VADKSYTVKLEQDGKDLILPLDEEMLKELGWDIGDKLIWTDNGDGTFTISRDDDDPLEGIEEAGC
jgi:bifunctional DNA-binding transcriptional regulator/antitoxin component of YhaV-PrlF toxin-antitoxin module